MKQTFEIATTPLRASDAEFTNFEGLKSLFGIGRSYAYQLADEGLIKSVCVRRPGKLRGKRLFVVASVREFLANQTDDVPAELSKQMREARGHKVQ